MKKLGVAQQTRQSWHQACTQVTLKLQEIPKLRMHVSRVIHIYSSQRVVANVSETLMLLSGSKASVMQHSIAQHGTAWHSIPGLGADGSGPAAEPTVVSGLDEAMRML